MTTPDARGSLFVNADWSALVPAGSVEAAFGLTVEEAKRRGLLPLGSGEHFAVPEVLHGGSVVTQSALVVEPVVVEPVEPEAVEVAAEEPEAKQAPKPANKAARKPRNK